MTARGASAGQMAGEEVEDGGDGIEVIEAPAMITTLHLVEQHLGTVG